MKPFAERSHFALGAIGISAVVVIATVALLFQKIPFVSGTTTYSGYFEDASGLHTGAPVDISGFPAGRVASIDLDGPRVLIKFTVDDDVHLGERTEAAIKTKGLLGSKMLEVVPKGDGDLKGTIPLERTVSAYQLPDALGDVTNAISGLDTHQLSDSLATVSEAFANTAPDLRDAVNGIARFSKTLNDRDAQLRGLLDNAAKATTVLAKRSDQVVSLVKNTNALLVQLRSQSAAVSRLWNSLSAVSQQLKGLIAENKTQLRPALDKLNGVVTMLDNRKERLQEAVKRLSQYAMALGDAVGSGPFFKAYIVNLLPGPVRAAVRRCRVLGPRGGPEHETAVAASGSAGRPAGHPAVAGAVPAHRPGRRPTHDHPGRDHRQARRHRVRPARNPVARARLLPRPRSGTGPAARWAAARTAAARTRDDRHAGTTENPATARVGSR